MATDVDFVDVVAHLAPDEFQDLYFALHLRYQEIEQAEASANTSDVSLKARSVLRFWRQSYGHAATREVLLAALEKCGNRYAREELEEKWNMKLTSDVGNLEPNEVAAQQPPDVRHQPREQEKLAFEDLIFHEELGSGENQVLRVTFKQGSFKGHTQAAVKCIPEKDRLEHEVDTMRSLQHPNTLLEFVQGPPPSAPGYSRVYYLVMELGEDSLHKYPESVWLKDGASTSSSKTDRSVKTSDQISKFIGPEGGFLELINGVIHLSIPPEALADTTNISVSIASPTDVHPPPGDNFIIAPIVRLEPDGLQFLRPATLSVKHSAVNLTLDKLQIWTKTGTQDWQIYNTSDRDVTKDLTLVKIRTSHFCWWCLLGFSKLKVQILPYIPSDLRESTPISMIVYAVKEFEAKFVHEDMTKKKAVLCCDSVVKYYHVKKHKKLEIHVHNVTDRKNAEIWKVDQSVKEISKDNIKIGRGNACCRFKFTTNDESQVDSIKGVLTAKQENNSLVVEVYVKHIMGPPSPEYRAVMASDDDFDDVIDILGPEELEDLYTGLKLEAHKISTAKTNANTSNVSHKARNVLGFWRKTNGQAATRKALLKALEDHKNRKARQKLEDKWNMKLSGDVEGPNQEAASP